MLNDWAAALESGRFIVRSDETLQEAQCYIHTPQGPEHSGSLAEQDPSGAKANHGDRVIASALCWKGMRDFKPEKQEHHKVVPGSIAWRRQEAQRANGKKLAKERYW